METKFYQVGGSVRDEIMGLRSKDIDYTVVSESFDTMRQAILARGGQIFLETPKFLTIRAKVPKLGACDYVLARKEGSYYDGRHPETVEPGTLYDDLARRDFTVNAIAKDEDGNYIDPFYGMDDIKEKIIRCVGNTHDRFAEDHLRILRAIRFSITKDFMMSYDIRNYLLEVDCVGLLLNYNVSLERVREELYKCFKHNTRETISTLHFYGLTGLFQEMWLKPTTEQ